METALVNIGVGVIAAAFGVFAGVRVHSSQIEEINRRLERMEEKLDDISKRIKWE